MTDMKRTSVSLPDELVDAIEKLRDTEEYKRATYSEIIRILVARGLKTLAEEQTA